MTRPNSCTEPHAGVASNGIRACARPPSGDASTLTLCEPTACISRSVTRRARVLPAPAKEIERGARLLHRDGAKVEPRVICPEFTESGVWNQAAIDRAFRNVQ